jgi:hypothetical protein
MLGTVASKLIVTVAAANVAAIVISTDWALPLNTLLLVILAIVSRGNGKKIEETKDHIADKLDDAAVASTHVASAAAAAAASALTAARISKEIGGALRGVHVPEDVSTDPPADPPSTSPEAA